MQAQSGPFEGNYFAVTKRHRGDFGAQLQDDIIAVILHSITLTSTGFTSISVGIAALKRIAS